MINKNKKILHFEDTTVWQDSVTLSVLIYELTKRFPAEEKYGIVNQVCRSANSVSANLAEGFGRMGVKEKTQFYSIAYGSLLETKSFLYLSRELGFCSDISSLVTHITSLQKQINAIKASIKDKK